MPLVQMLQSCTNLAKLFSFGWRFFKNTPIVPSDQTLVILEANKSVEAQSQDF
jgi:hypothetical protein